MDTKVVIPAVSANQAVRVPVPEPQPAPRTLQLPPIVFSRSADENLLASVPLAGCGANCSVGTTFAPSPEPKNSEESAMMANRLNACEHFVMQFEVACSKLEASGALSPHYWSLNARTMDTQEVSPWRGSAIKTLTAQFSSMLLRRHEFDWQQPHQWWNTALLYSVAIMDKTLMELALAQGADVNARFEFDYPAFDAMRSRPVNRHGVFSPLIAAAENNDVDTTLWLLSMGAQVNAATSDHGPALLQAVRKGYEHLAELLIEHGAEVDRPDAYGNTALHVAAGQGNEWAVRLLLTHGADVSAQDAQGQTPIYRLWSRDRTSRHDPEQDTNVRLLRLLLDQGADIHHTDFHGRTVLVHAAQCGSHAGVALLLAKGSRVDDVDKDGHAAIWHAHQDTDYRMAAILLEHGARVDCKGRQGPDLLKQLIVNNQQQAIPALLRQGLDCNDEDEAGQSPLDMATGWNRVAAVQAILRHGADVNHVSGAERRTALFKAVRFDFRPVLDALLASPCIEPDHRDIDGKTALHLAAEANRPYAVLRLLDRGAAIDLPDQYGNSALAIACAHSHWDIARALRARSADSQRSHQVKEIPSTLPENARPEALRVLPALDHKSGKAIMEFVKLLKDFGSMGDLEDALDWQDWLSCQGVGPRTIEALARASAAHGTVLEAMTGHDRDIVQPALQIVACAGLLAGLADNSGDTEAWAGLTGLASAGHAAEASLRTAMAALDKTCTAAGNGLTQGSPVNLYRHLTSVYGMAGLFAQDVASTFCMTWPDSKNPGQPARAFATRLKETLESSYLTEHLAQARAKSGNPETFAWLMQRQYDMLVSYCKNTLAIE